MVMDTGWIFLAASNVETISSIIHLPKSIFFFNTGETSYSFLVNQLPENFSLGAKMCQRTTLKLADLNKVQQSVIITQAHVNISTALLHNFG